MRPEKRCLHVLMDKTPEKWQKWDSNPRLQRRLRPERSALDRSAILTILLTSLLKKSEYIADIDC